MSKHTPGPWTAIPDDTGDEREWYVVTEEEGVLALSVSEEADARLIAAAPDLLAALKFVSTDPCFNVLGSVTHDEVRAAIAKAEGGS